MNDTFGVNNVSVEFGEVQALDQISLQVPSGQVTAIVGGDGAGKSTLLKVLSRQVLPNIGEVSSTDKKHLGYQPATSGVWRELSVVENIDFVGRSYGMKTDDISVQTDRLLRRAGLEEARHRLGSELSGGMRQKLGFLLAIMHDPTLVLLDEPSTGVDPVSRVELWRLIAETAASGAAILMTTTYLDEAARAANILALDKGKAIAYGSPNEIMSSIPGIIGIGKPDPSATFSWQSGSRRLFWMPDGTKFEGEKYTNPDLKDAIVALTLAQSKIPEDRPEETAPLPKSSIQENSIIASGKNISKSFKGITAVDDVTIEVKSGQIVGLIGANGAGKTTFLRTLIGLSRADNGTVSLFGAPPDKSSHKRMGYVPQGLGLYKNLSIEENAAFYRRVFGTALVKLPENLEKLRRTPVGKIGLGLQRQLAFALALSHGPELLILDEPTSGVDPLTRAELWDTIHAQAEAGRGIIVTTHYMEEATQCSTLALMSHGRLVGSGTIADLTCETTAVLVETEHWQDAFNKLGSAGLPTMLDGRNIRVAGTSIGDVKAALGNLAANITSVPPTLEETMVLNESALPYDG